MSSSIDNIHIGLTRSRRHESFSAIKAKRFINHRQPTGSGEASKGLGKYDIINTRRKCGTSAGLALTDPLTQSSGQALTH